MSRVLVVDDEPQIRRALATNLRARGYEVDLAPTGEEALRLAAAHRPLEQRFVMRYQKVELIDVDKRIAQRARHSAVDLGHHDLG